MGCKCCRWPVNACRMARMVKLLPLSFTGLVLFLTVHSFYNDAVITGTLLLILFFPVFGFLPRKPLNLPPGPSGIPVLGYLPFLGEKPHQEMAKLAKKYGPLVHIQLGSFPGLVVANARLAKEVLMTQDQVFSSRPDSFVTWAKHFAYYHEGSEVRYSMGTAKPGPFLRNMRRLVAVELVAPKRIEHFKAIRREEMDAMVQELLSEVKSGKQIVDLNMAIGALAMNVMSRMVIQKRYYAKDISPETKKEAYEFQRLLVTVLTWAGYPFLQDFVPGLRPLMSMISSNEREMAKMAKNTDAFFETILQEHRQRQNTVESSQDFVDVLIQSVGDDGKRLDDKAIKAVTMEMFMAGAETTATTIEWALAELLHHPDIQTNLQTELDTVIGTTRMAQESDIPNLPYLHAVIRESFRLHPVSPLMIPHSNSEATELDGYHIPANSHIFINSWAIGRDSSIWSSPEHFDPERFHKSNKFLDSQSSEDQRSMVGIDYKGLSYELLPFGSGRRGCPGMQIASHVVSVAVARLVHGFRWSLADDRAPEDMDMEERFGMNLQMRSPLHRVCCEKRLPEEVYLSM
ncbi:hypothetical protein KC19_3G213900 [Ceratodon purpureus]|uniref:Cytochrome P450 n=1 Tax=Ceratodon purpureus TaxID=3225 RepID=A0A8T0IPH4_CERPU|nr:hypothetical protein KC19_3G213900 [Ceratodon purpureus]